MTVENQERRPSKVVDRLWKAGSTMLVIGTGTAIVGGFAMSTEVAGTGGAIAAVGFGIDKIAERIERKKS